MVCEFVGLLITGILEEALGLDKNVGVDNMPKQTEFEMVEHGSTFQDEAFKQWGELNILECEDIPLSIDTKTTAGKGAFNLVDT